MPNWCNNRLTLTHKDADILDNLKAHICFGGDHEGDLFQFIKPIPKDYTEGDSWYWWCVSNWGTKWDACNMSWSQLDDHTLEFDFDTAWSPPLGVYEELARQGFGVEAYYVEYGMMFAGEWHCDDDGLGTDDHSNDISKYVPEGVDEVFDVTETLKEWEEEEADNGN